ncbi:MAG: SAM-dependent chlorinase/fluorinase [bacterium]|nr:SAM-dependent chlorinase/fluorinase [bacterium]
MMEQDTKRTVALLTDFGPDSWYVGAMKGTLLRIDPDLSLVDITHSVSPYRIAEASFILLSVYRAFAPGTVFLCVVDPTVGSERRGLVARMGDYYFVLPDNGLLSDLLQHEPDCEIRYLDEELPLFEGIDPCPTFHGRDLFAPVTALLAQGRPLKSFGPLCTQPVELMLFEPLPDDEALSGNVVLIDSFGNLITDIRAARIAKYCREYGVQRSDLVVEVGRERILGLLSSYHEGMPGRPLALIGSNDYLELAVNRGDAHKLLKLEAGAKVTLSVADRSRDDV